MRVLFASGGTGGHILPIIAVKQELETIAQSRNIPIEFLLVGHLDSVAQSLLDSYHIPYKSVYAGKLRRYFSIHNILDVFRAVYGLIMAQWYIWKFMPDVTFGKGGYASVPGVLISWLYQIPTLIHESDSVPGLANKFLGRFASVVAVGFPAVQEVFGIKKTAIVGNMTHPDIMEGSRDNAGTYFRLTFEKPIVLIVGGSQGAQIINQVIWEIIPELTKIAEIIHIVGKNNISEASKVTKSLPPSESRLYHYVGFLNEEMKDAYASADLVISRAGASSIADICLTRKPSILVPITIDAGQQRSNAYEMAKIGASIVLEEPNFTPHIVLSKVDELLKQPNIMKSMSDQTIQFASPDAALRIAEQLFDLPQKV
jgi:UDP-N-acetylglucosamine--N-acetylmuramyl-(pentapeptide) pyrophosphoryl-undecaprenol N-acetylglucosamine transferase